MNENKAFIAEYFEALSGKPKDPSLVARYVTDPHLIQHIAAFEEGFPGYELIAEDTIAEGDRVAVRATYRGVQKGAFAGVAATGRPVSGSVMIIYRIAGRKIVQSWMEFNPGALMQQLSEPATSATA